MLSKEFKAKEFKSIGLIKKNMMIDELMEEANKLNVNPALMVTLFEKMYKITVKFLEIEKRLDTLETTPQIAKSA